MQYKYTTKSVSFAGYFQPYFNMYLICLNFFCTLRSFFSSAIHQSSSPNKIDEYIKKLDFDLRRMGRISKSEIEEILNEIKTSSEFFQEFLPQE